MSTEPTEFIAFDLIPVRAAHPEHAAVIDRFCQRANPPYTWGVMSTASLLKRHYSDTTVEEQFESNLWAFIGETAEQRDQRVIERFRREMVDYASTFGAVEDLLQILRDLKSAYYLITYAETGPATKILKQ
jgi:hypothetical protein